jgi:2-keto-4-pentenoate hydratase
LALNHGEQMTGVLVSAERQPLAARERRRIARGLIEAARSGQPIAPLSGRFSALTVADAQRVRDATLAYRLATGERLIGAKVSVPEAPGRQPLASEPALGWITDAMMLPGNVVNPGELIRPRVEPRLALMLDRSVRKRMATVGELLAAVVAAFPALEIVDSRYDHDDLTVVDHVADNCGAARLLIGRSVAPPAEGTLRRLRLPLSMNGALPPPSDRTVAPALSALEASVWLANALTTTRDDITGGALLVVPAGDAAVDLRPGVHVQTHDPELGSLELWG